jgi:cell division protein ZapA
MPDLDIAIGGRTFQVACQAGEEPFLRAAAALLDAEAQPLMAQAGRLPESRMLLMAGLMLADRLAGLEDQLRNAEARLHALESLPPPAPERIEVRIEVSVRRLAFMTCTVKKNPGGRVSASAMSSGTTCGPALNTADPKCGVWRDRARIRARSVRHETPHSSGRAQFGDLGAVGGHAMLMRGADVGVGHQPVEFGLQHRNAGLDAAVLDHVVVHAEPVVQPLVAVHVVHPAPVAFDQKAFGRPHA